MNILSERVPRTHPSQWTTLVDFVENHPEMVTHNFVGINGRENYNKLWEELTEQLNSAGFGRKKSKKWQEVFGKWKSKVKTKAQNIVCGLKKTGGGGPLPQLTPTEERLMAIIGWKIVTGDENKEMGVKNNFMDQREEAVGEAKENTPHNSTIDISSLPLVPETVDQSMDNILKQKPVDVSAVTVEVPALTLFKQTITTGATNTKSDMSGTPIRLKQKERKRKVIGRSFPENETPRREQPNLVNMHNENIEILKNINTNLSRIADIQEKQNKLFAEFLESFQFK